MSHSQTQPQSDPAYGPVQPHRKPVFGLGITTSILGIASSLWVFILALGITFFALDILAEGVLNLFITITSVVLWALAALMLVLGILAIVRNRQRGAKLLAVLSGAAVLSVLVALYAGVSGITGGGFWIISVVLLLPLIVVSLLAFLAAKKTAQQEPALQS